MMNSQEFRQECEDRYPVHEFEPSEFDSHYCKRCNEPKVNSQHQAN